MKYHSFFAILKKKRQNFKLSSAQIIGGALWVKALHAM